MSLRCSAFTLLIMITCVHASPQALPRFCRAPLVTGLCRILTVSWHLNCPTKKCIMQPNVLCSRTASVFSSEKSCLFAGKRPLKPIMGSQNKIPQRAQHLLKKQEARIRRA
uniref:Pancreatic trypsin inhibitor n=1 Tax=Rhipicephalus appendiculatus TaxID=34631 RepID=A0A131YMV7_RHIAP